MRTTIHMIPTDHAGWWLPLFEPGIERWSRRRLSQLGLPEHKQDEALRVTAEALADEGPLTRTEVRERIVSAGIELNSRLGCQAVIEKPGAYVVEIPKWNRNYVQEGKPAHGPGS